MKIAYRQCHHKDKKGAKMTTEMKKRYLEAMAIKMKKQDKEWYKMFADHIQKGLLYIYEKHLN